jgi:PKD repeat protein
MIYFLFLIIIADASNCDDFVVNVNIGIDADFTYEPNNPKIGEKIVFTDTSTPDIAVNWTWDFGDGEILYLQNPTHSYSNIGTYQIKLTVLTEGGINNTKLKSISFLKKVSSSSQIYPPHAISNGPYYGVTNRMIHFNGSLSFDSDGNIVSYIWDLGDGTIKYGEFVTHSYESIGNYTVKLTVEDNHGLTDVDSKFSYIFKDTDNDGWDDYIEEIYETDPLEIDDHPLDTDNDGIPDESVDGIIMGDRDDDNDGLEDEIEESIGSNPKDADDISVIIIGGITYFLVDTDGDYIWDFIYNPIAGALNPYIIEEQKEDSFVLLFIGGIAFFVIVIILFKTGTISAKLLFIEKYKEKMYYFSRKKTGKFKSDKDKENK